MLKGRPVLWLAAFWFFWHFLHFFRVSLSFLVTLAALAIMRGSGSAITSAGHLRYGAPWPLAEGGLMRAFVHEFIRLIVCFDVFRSTLRVFPKYPSIIGLGCANFVSPFFCGIMPPD